MATHWLVFGLAACLAGFSSPQQAPQANRPKGAQVQPMRAEELTMEKLFRGRSYSGQQARGAAFSHSGRYLAYVWNPFGENGADLYIHDTQTGQTKRVTSLDTMKVYDPPEMTERFIKKAAEREKQIEETQAKVDAQAAYLLGSNINLDKWDMAAIEAMKKDDAEKKAKAEAEKQKAEAEKKTEEGSGEGNQAETRRGGGQGGRQAQQSQEKELWEWRDELKKKQEKDNIRPSDLYPGVSNIDWAHQSDELIFTYRGDYYRNTGGGTFVSSSPGGGGGAVYQLMGYSQTTDWYAGYKDSNGNLVRTDTYLRSDTKYWNEWTFVGYNWNTNTFMASSGGPGGGATQTPSLVIKEGDQVLPPLKGTWPNILNFISPRTYGPYSVDNQGKITGMAPITGIAPTPGIKGGVLKPLGLGSTGRTAAANLTEKLALKEIMNNPRLGTVVMEGMKDTRWLGWSKMQYVHRGLDGTTTTIHYVGRWENGVLNAIDDFKFVFPW
jgi:hypothetical protein